MNEDYVNYLLSTNILKGLKEQNLITEKEFTDIDNLNKKSFKVAENQWFDLINVQSNYNMNVQKEYKN